MGFRELESNSNVWTLQELLEALRLFREYGTTSNKFCFFIDGLDEYERDHQMLIDFVKELVHSPNVKLCILVDHGMFSKPPLGTTRCERCMSRTSTREIYYDMSETSLKCASTFKKGKDEMLVSTR